MEIHELFAARRQVLSRIAESFDGPKKALAAKLEVTAPTLSRLLNEDDPKPIGEELALRMESKLDLAPGTMLLPYVDHFLPRVITPDALSNMQVMSAEEHRAFVETLPAPTVSGAVADLAVALQAKSKESRKSIKSAVVDIIDEPMAAEPNLKIVRLVMEEPDLHINPSPRAASAADALFRKLAHAEAKAMKDSRLRDFALDFVSSVEAKTAEKLRTLVADQAPRLLSSDN